MSEQVIQNPPVAETTPRQRTLEVPNGPEGIYLASLYTDLNHIYATHFPEIYRDPGIRAIKIGPPQIHRQYTSEGIKEIPLAASGRADPRDKTIVLEYGVKDSSKLGPDDLVLGLSPFPTDIKRKLLDILIMNHEINHPIFDQLTNFDSKVYFEGGEANAVQKYTTSVDGALSEGFASLMEFLALDVIRGNPKLLNFSLEDVTTLTNEKRKRMFGFTDYNDGEGFALGQYPQGLVKIMHKIYRDAAGPPKNRDMHQGVKAIADFASRVDRNKAMNIPRTDPRFISILKTGNMQQLGPLVFKAA